MASGSAPLPSRASPTKKSSQELPSRASQRRHDGSDSSSSSDSGSDSGSDGESDNGRPSDVIAADVTADEMVLDNGTTAPAARDLRAQAHTPELQTNPPGQSDGNGNGNGNRNGRSGQAVSKASILDAQHPPGTPGHIPPFDWDEFEARYEQALAEMNGEEKELLEDFDQLVNYFNVWATAASAHDDERAVKRLQTRERYVKIAEQSLGQRKQHLTEVVRAFQSALALLSQT